jgi:hypothetical protein
MTGNCYNDAEIIAALLEREGLVDLAGQLRRAITDGATAVSIVSTLRCRCEEFLSDGNVCDSTEARIKDLLRVLSAVVAEL